MVKILFFSNNKNKIDEVSKLFQNSKYTLNSLNDFDKIHSPDESGKSFEENAKIKSLFGFEKFNTICFADDSGICVEAMGGDPGINSKDLLESNNDKKIILNKIILNAIKSNNHKAFFQTSICLSINKEKQFFFTGRIHGTITKEIKGVGGFGYDPIFIPSGNKKTFAEMSLQQKNIISHRSIAIKKMLDYILKLV